MMLAILCIAISIVEVTVAVAVAAAVAVTTTVRSLYHNPQCNNNQRRSCQRRMPLR